MYHHVLLFAIFHGPILTESPSPNLSTLSSLSLPFLLEIMVHLGGNGGDDDDVRKPMFAIAQNLANRFDRIAQQRPTARDKGRQNMYSCAEKVANLGRVP